MRRHDLLADHGTFRGHGRLRRIDLLLIQPGLQLGHLLLLLLRQLLLLLQHHLVLLRSKRLRLAYSLLLSLLLLLLGLLLLSEKIPMLHQLSRSV